MTEKSKRQKIVDAVDALFKTIRISNGYDTDIGQNVEWWKTRLTPAALPSIVCRDRLLPPEADNRWRRRLIIEIEIFLSPASPASDPAEEMRKALADIETCIGADTSDGNLPGTWGGIAEDTELYESEQMGINDWESSIIADGFGIIIEYTTEAWNPRA